MNSKWCFKKNPIKVRIEYCYQLGNILNMLIEAALQPISTTALTFYGLFDMISGPFHCNPHFLQKSSMWEHNCLHFPNPDFILTAPSANSGWPSGMNEAAEVQDCATQWVVCWWLGNKWNDTYNWRWSRKVIFLSLATRSVQAAEMRRKCQIQVTPKYEHGALIPQPSPKTSRRSLLMQTFSCLLYVWTDRGGSEDNQMVVMLVVN